MLSLQALTQDNALRIKTAATNRPAVKCPEVTKSYKVLRARGETTLNNAYVSELVDIWHRYRRLLA
jgi:hypothetical protein